MHTPHPPRPSYPPRPRLAPGESDEALAARLRGRPVGEATQPVALLMARHWQPAHEYAVICLASSADVASMVAATAFHRILGELMRSGSAGALRPRILVAVRDTVGEWAADERISGVLRELRKPAGGRGIRNAKSLTPENRILAERAFRGLPELAQCLLWHTEVEAEHISVPAVLLGMNSEAAAAALEQARDQFRAGCVRAHRELAPTNACRFHNRLLDIPLRRGGALLPEVQQHLLECPYCRSAAEQLSHFEGALGGLLAEAVLGWGAQRYLDSRPGRRAYRAPTRPGPGGNGRHAAGGRRRLLSRIPAEGRRIAEERNTRALLTGVGLTAAVVLAGLLVAGLWTNDGGADPVASTRASGTSTTLTPAPGSGAQSGTAGHAVAPQRTRLRDLGAGLCLDIRGTVRAGAHTRLATCSSALTQQWSYESDGLLRSIADPGLCLDSRAADGIPTLAPCVDAGQAHADDVRYDLTARGELLPRGNENLAVTPASTDPDTDIVIRTRDGSDTQRWATDGQPAKPMSLSVAGADDHRSVLPAEQISPR
ncbi:RICIN domain-containing protein [Streptomyces glomeratus]|uniref:RICIN domain-containing protein n=1 Tax=Streptomyces glomeratus TaxID=284452 RepID=A0ABP6LF34_9ACTN|nr:RICIN domain-containing protein [Streptomyces glomeratus]MCF1510991.1 RICIN domain-containing protein [Streptomyces glomeratus]